ncbi:hypothetical protein [Bacteriovorax sp. Seq25_V]|uniref:hypothetical protein n=1 Tax=Bacteriovorax sp. Seq25_V TaxID=1201288 RepID=UPI00038A5266|nr:hypothetical protein [Bacteriovorax sp. Seq25_V]EQC46559.1 hypothetical protein M900_2429 [Bacteriovorax sp. Seq25_V]
MVRKSTLSLVLLLSLFCLITNAGSFYSGLSYSFSGVVAEDDIYNGAYHWDPGIVFGAQFGRLSIDSQIKNLKMKKEYESNGDKFDIEIHSLLLTMGLRLEVMPFISFNIGTNYQNVDSSYKAINSNKFINGLPDKHYMSYYVGGGVFGEVFTNVIGRLDLNYYRGDQNFGLLAVDLALAYRVLTF